MKILLFVLVLCVSCICFNVVVKADVTGYFGGGIIVQLNQNGEKHGVEVESYGNGVSKRETPYNNGKRDGVEKWY